MCLAGWSPPSLALGLGPLELNSALGQPLAAHVTLTSVSAAERASLRARLGDAQAYERFGLQYAAVLEAIDVDVDVDASAGDRVVLELTSLQPIQAPLLELLVIVETERGRMLRQYTAFLSPAGGSGGVNVDQQVAPPDSSNHVPVMPGDTLWDIATHYKYTDASLDQMMVAIYRNNPDAFGDDISRLRVGSTLHIPAPSEVRAVDPTQARTQVVRAQDQWLDRITRMTLANNGPASDTGSGGGRLRLVAPHSFPLPGRAVPEARGNAEQQMSAPMDNRVGSGFGRLSPLAGAQPATTPFDTNGAPAAGTVEAAHTAPAENEAGGVAMAFGRLAVAPNVFAAAGPSPTAMTHDAPAATTQAPSKQRHGDVEPKTPSAPTAAGGGVSMHMVPWILTALFLLLAVVLWLLFRLRRPPEVALLAGLAAGAPSEQSDEVGR